MPEFLAETYAPRDAAGAGAPSAGDIARATAQASGPGAPVRFLGAIAAPDDEICFWLYQAPSAGAVRAAMVRARLRPERITPAVTLRPPLARPGPAPRPPRTTRQPAPEPAPPGTPSWPPRAAPPPPGTGPALTLRPARHRLPGPGATPDKHAATGPGPS